MCTRVPTLEKKEHAKIIICKLEVQYLFGVCAMFE